MLKKILQKLQNWLEKKLNSTINAADVFSYNPKIGKMYLGSYLMTEAEIRNLQEEIKYLEKTRIWEVWQNTVKKLAIDTAIYESTSFEDMRTGKSFLKVLATLQDINTVIKSWKPAESKTKLPNSPIEY